MKTLRKDNNKTLANTHTAELVGSRARSLQAGIKVCPECPQRVERTVLKDNNNDNNNDIIVY